MKTKAITPRLHRIRNKANIASQRVIDCTNEEMGWAVFFSIGWERSLEKIQIQFAQMMGGGKSE